MIASWLFIWFTWSVRFLWTRKEHTAYTNSNPKNKLVCDTDDSVQFEVTAQKQMNTERNDYQFQNIHLTWNHTFGMQYLLQVSSILYNVFETIPRLLPNSEFLWLICWGRPKTFRAQGESDRSVPLFLIANAKLISLIMIEPPPKDLSLQCQHSEIYN